MQFIVVLIACSIWFMVYFAFKLLMWVFQPLTEYAKSQDVKFDDVEFVDDLRIPESEEESLRYIFEGPTEGQEPKESFIVKVRNANVLFSLDLIKCDLQPKPKNDIIKDMVKLFVKSGMVKDGVNFYKKLRLIQNIGSRGIGNNIAIPFNACDAQEDIVVAVGISRSGVDFDSLDGEPVKIIFMSAHNKVSMESDDTMAHDKWLARISYFLKKTDNRNALINAKSEKEVFDYIKMNLPAYFQKSYKRKR